MKLNSRSLCSTGRHFQGLSLVEVTLVISLILVLASIVSYSFGSITKWSKGRDASEKLRSVYVAQKSFLADRPSKDYTTFTEGELIPYLPNHQTTMPEIKGLEGQILSINIQVMPPVCQIGGAVYDPSDSSTDGLWDVGKL